MAFIIFLTIAAASRENASLCIAGARAYLKLALCCWPAALFTLALSYFSQVWHYGNPLGEMLAPLLQAAGRPWSSALLTWLFGGLALAIALFFLPVKFLSSKQDYLNFGITAASLLASACASLFFYASLCLINWPFAGLPPDITLGRAAMTIMRHALHQYIMAFCPAGAFALLLTFFMTTRIPPNLLPLALRWPAIWATGGAMPTLLQSWGIVLGLGLGGRLSGSLSQGLWEPVLEIICLTMAAFIWVCIIWRPLRWQKWSITAFGLLILKAAMPIIALMLR